MRNYQVINHFKPLLDDKLRILRYQKPSTEQLIKLLQGLKKIYAPYSLDREHAEKLYAILKLKKEEMQSSNHRYGAEDNPVDKLFYQFILKLAEFIFKKKLRQSKLTTRQKRKKQFSDQEITAIDNVSESDWPLVNQFRYEEVIPGLKNTMRFDTHQLESLPPQDLFLNNSGYMLYAPDVMAFYKHSLYLCNTEVMISLREHMALSQQDCLRFVSSSTAWFKRMKRVMIELNPVTNEAHQLADDLEKTARALYDDNDYEVDLEIPVGWAGYALADGSKAYTILAEFNEKLSGYSVQTQEAFHRVVGTGYGFYPLKSKGLTFSELTEKSVDRCHNRLGSDYKRAAKVFRQSINNPLPTDYLKPSKYIAQQSGRKRRKLGLG